MIITAYSTLKQRIDPEFDHDVSSFCDRSVPGFGDELAVLAAKLCDDGQRELNPTLWGVLRHLERTRHRVTLDLPEVDSPRSMSNATWRGVSEWAMTSNSILRTTDQKFRDPQSRILASLDDGDFDTTAQLPYHKESIDRRLRSGEALLELGIGPCDVPPTPSSEEIVSRQADEVAWRLLALFIVAVRAESLATGQPIEAGQLRARSPMAFEAMSPAELAFVENLAPDAQTVANFVWRYETLHCLQWTLGLKDQLKFPDQICDVPRVAELMVDRDDRELVNSAHLRPIGEILDAVDQNTQLLWAARKAHFDGHQPPVGADGGILSERQHALNWLIRFPDVAWDDVDTPT